MNIEQEIREAIEDYNAGMFVFLKVEEFQWF